MKVADIEVKLLDSMGTDLSVANVARVSFDKQHDELTDGDVKLINYLATHDHWSPFAHAFAQFRITAPLYVARQLVKHQIGLSWNEVSRRYVDSAPEFYIPKELRGRAENVKQGSGGAIGVDPVFIRMASVEALHMYNYLLAEGVAPEQARMVLPLNTMTTWVWSGSVAAFARVCNQRLDSHAQAECRDVAREIHRLLAPKFPHSLKALVSTE
jgi:thymidylate synthase (FAD)